MNRHNNLNKPSPVTTRTVSNSLAVANPNNNNNMSSATSQAMLKRRKSNSLSIIDYCNIINLNTNYQMLAAKTLYEDTEESMARLSLKSNKDICKQASLSEQVAALFGSSMCTCNLCNLKSTTTTTTSTTWSSNELAVASAAAAAAAATSVAASASTPVLNSSSHSSNQTNTAITTTTTTSSVSSTTISNRKVQQHNFEISPNKNNSDFSVIKYTYSTPFSQLSTLKLFNIMNTDCSINVNFEQNKSGSFTKQGVSLNEINLMLMQI